MTSLYATTGEDLVSGLVRAMCGSNMDHKSTLIFGNCNSIVLYSYSFGFNSVNIHFNLWQKWQVLTIWFLILMAPTLILELQAISPTVHNVKENSQLTDLGSLPCHGKHDYHATALPLCYMKQNSTMKVHLQFVSSHKPWNTQRLTALQTKILIWPNQNHNTFKTAQLLENKKRRVSQLKFCMV